MRINQTYRSLLDKSINAMLSAIEIYNKPHFSYREETFAVLAINGWELLFKSQLLKVCGYQIKCLYVLEPALTKTGKVHKTKKKPRLNRSQNPITLGLFEVIKKMEEKGLIITQNHKDSIESLVELRDNAIHFYNDKYISKEIQELGFACIKNYIHLIKKWNIEIDISSYNFYLMPLAYVDSKVLSDGLITDEVKNYIDFIKNQIDNQDVSDEDFDIAISIDVNFSKSTSYNGIGFKFNSEGLPVTITEEDMRNRFPFTYEQVIAQARLKFSDFKKGKKFNEIMKEIKKNPNLYYERKLDLSNVKSQIKPYYNGAIFKELSKYFTKN